MVATSGGDSLAANTALQTATPWPRYANDTNIPADGARMANVVKRYESGGASESGAQSPGYGGAGGASGLSGMNGASTGPGIASAPSASPPPQRPVGRSAGWRRRGYSAGARYFPGNLDDCSSPCYSQTAATYDPLGNGRARRRIHRNCDAVKSLPHLCPFADGGGGARFLRRAGGGGAYLVFSALGACLDNSGLWWRRLLESDSVCL